MTKSLSFMAALFVLLASPLLSEAATKKYYCSPQQIDIGESTILVHLADDQIFEIDTLLVDQGGVYFTEDAMRCYECRRWNAPTNDKSTKNICSYECRRWNAPTNDKSTKNICHVGD